MKLFENKVAVITGGASGIGRGLAEYCAQKGMKIVLADVETDALRDTASEMQSTGGDVIAVRTDVSKLADVQRLAQKTMEAYGRVDLLFNNAGVGAGPSLWECTENDCKWVVGVNLWGTIYGIREFVPIMIKQQTPCHIVNTASIGGLTTFHPSALYQLTKHSIVALSEQLYHDFALRGLHIKVSVLCPGFVNTRIMDMERNRPKAYKNAAAEDEPPAEAEENEVMFRQMVAAGMPPSRVAEIVFAAIAEERFYIFTHPETKLLVETRMEAMLAGRNPSRPPMGEPE